MWLAACSSGLAAVAAPLRPRIATESFRCHCSNIQWQLMLQQIIIIFKIIKNLAYKRYKKLEYKKKVSNIFNNNVIMLSISKFNLLNYFNVMGNLYARKIYLK